MGRFTSDAELGFPKYHLKNSNILLMERCILSEYSHSKNQYHWFNTDVFGINPETPPKLIPPEKIPNHISRFGKISNKWFVNLIYLVIVLSLYFFLEKSFLTYLPGTGGPLLATLCIFLLVLLVWDYAIYDYLTKNMQLKYTIEVYLPKKKHPILLSSEKGNDIDRYFWENFFIFLIRFPLLIAIAGVDPAVEFIDAVVWYLSFTFGVILFFLGSSLLGGFCFLIIDGKQYFSGSYRYVESLNVKNFHIKLIEMMNYEKENYEISLEEIIIGKETPDKELKASYWTDDQDRSKNLLLQDAVIKVVAGMLNSDGGHVVIGIKDNTKLASGLVDEDIMQLKSEKSWDRLETHIVTTFENNLILGNRRKIMPNKDYILKLRKWPETEDGNDIIHIHIPKRLDCKVYAFQKALQKMKLKKWREKNQNLYPASYIPHEYDEKYKFRFLRKQTSTKHQTLEDWDAYWYNI